jgi:hypothetical protein
VTLPAIEWSADGKGGRYRFYLRPIGFFLGGKAGVVVPCPKCSRPAWRKAENLYVHEAAIALAQNEPVWDHTDDNACKLTKQEVSTLASAKEKAAKRG